MADLNRTIAIIFNGEDNISAPMAKMEKKISSFSRNVSDSVAPLHAASTAILTLNAALAALAVGGLVLAFNASKDFESSTIELKKVLGEGMSTDEAVENAFKLSNAYGQSASDILLSTANFKQAGFEISEALTLTKDSLDLVIAGNVDAARSSEIIISALKGFGIEAGEAGKFIDILNEVSNSYATDAEKLAVAMSKLSPIAKIMGFTMEETAGLVTPIIEVFRSGDDAAMALKTGLLKLIDDAKPVQDALSALGVAQTDVNGALRSGRDIYYDVATAFQGLTEKQKLFYTGQLSGIDQAGRMVTVFDNLELATQITATALDSAGSAAGEVAARLASSQVQVDRFKVGFSNLAVAIGDEFRDAAAGAIGGATKIELALRSIVTSGAFTDIFQAFNNFGVDLEQQLSDIAQRLPDAFKSVNFEELLASLGAVGESVSGLFDGMDLSTTEGLTAAIQAVIDTFTSLANVTGGIIKSLGLVIKPFELLLTTFNNLSPAAQSLVGNILGLGTALTVMSGVVAVGGVLIGGLSTLAVLISGPVGLTIGLAALGTALAKITVDHFAKQAAETASAIHGWNMEVADLTLAIAKIPPSKTTEIETLIAAGELEEARDLVDELVEEERIIHIKIESDITKEQAEWEKFKDAWGSFSEAKTIELTALANTGDFEAIEKMIAGLGVDPVEIQAELEAASKQKTEDDLKKLTEAKEIEIKLKGEIDKQIAQIISSAEVAQSAFEWSAKIDIAEAEAAAATTKAAFDSVGDSVVALSASTSDMFGALVGSMDNLSVLQQWDFMDILEDQQAAQNEALRTQSLLAEAQTEYVEARTKALKKGGGDIKISSDGLEPSLQMIMWQILEKVQLKANESAADFLMGINL